MEALYSIFDGIRCWKFLEFRRNLIGLRKNTARKLNERSVKRRKLFEERSDEFFLRSGANEASGIFSAALTFLVLFALRQKEQYWHNNRF